jgi:hypothetical protein
MAKKTEEPKEKELEDVIVTSQPKFLKGVQETYFLAVLGSLCIAVSAFTQQSYPQAQVYAVTGASLFLVAFVCSLVAKIFPSAFLIVPSYIATGAGVLMLFLITLEFYNAITLVSKAFTVIIIGLVVTIIATVPYNMYHYRKKSKGKTKHLLTTSIISLTVMVSSLTIMLVPSIVLSTSAILGTVAVISGIIFSISAILGLASTFIAIPFLFIERRRQRKEKKANITFVDEGSGL